MKKVWPSATVFLFCLVMLLSLHAPAFAEGGEIYDGRWLDADIQGLGIVWRLFSLG